MALQLQLVRGTVWRWRRALNDVYDCVGGGGESWCTQLDIVIAMVQCDACRPYCI